MKIKTNKFFIFIVLLFVLNIKSINNDQAIDNDNLFFDESDHSIIDYDLEISRRFNKLKLGILTSWRKKCGIAIYTEHIYSAMKKKGSIPIIFSHDLNYDRLIKRINLNEIKILNIQYEPSLFSNIYIKKLVNYLKSRNIRVIITVHWETEILKEIEKEVDLFVYHKEPTLNIKNFLIIPMGVPVFDAPKDRIKIREKYNFSSNDIIITTTGFLLTWKEYSSILEKLAGYIKSNAKIKLQMLTSFNQITKDECDVELKKINEVIEKYNLANQVIVITNFISQKELSERLWISDIGYLWGSLNSRGSSASLREFISARLPLITTESSHFNGINIGLIKTKIDKDIFVSKLISNLKDNEKLNILKNEMQALYDSLNYNALVKRYINIFKKTKGIYI